MNLSTVRLWGSPTVLGVTIPCIALLCLSLVRLEAAEVIPPKPAAYFNDYAGVASKDNVARFNEKLAQFERETSNQVVVAVYPKMETDSSVEDYAQRIAQSWKVGQGDKRNGVVLLVFIADRKSSIQVGYGLEGALPDVTAFDIRSRQMNPRFRTGQYEAGLAIGIDSIIKAIRGEYRGGGRTALESQRRIQQSKGNVPCSALFIAFIIFLIVMGRLQGGRRRRGWGYTGMGGPFIGGLGGGSSGGGWSSGGGGFSGFSGGGGSFGGGGSSGSW